MFSYQVISGHIPNQNFQTVQTIKKIKRKLSMKRLIAAHLWFLVSRFMLFSCLPGAMRCYDLDHRRPKHWSPYFINILFISSSFFSSSVERFRWIWFASYLAVKKICVDCPFAIQFDLRSDPCAPCVPSNLKIWLERTSFLIELTEHVYSKCDFGFE